VGLKRGPLGNPEQGRKLSVDLEIELAEPVARHEVHLFDQLAQLHPDLLAIVSLKG
jgi:hypothetical protein